MEEPNGITEAYGLADSGHIPLVPNDQIDAAWCLNFIRAVRDTALATVDADGTPNVRIIDIMMIKGGKPYFLVPRGKAVHDEICANPQVALVAQAVDFRTCRLKGRAVRVEGESEHTDAIDEMFRRNPGMETLYPGENRYICDAFYIAEGQGEFFDLGQKPIFRKSFQVGGTRTKETGFRVNDACTSCGVCMDVCPSHCIEWAEDGGAFIRQEHCLHCGLCFEHCPSDAIDCA